MTEARIIVTLQKLQQQWFHSLKHFVTVFANAKSFSTFSAAFLPQFGKSSDGVVDSECPSGRRRTFPLHGTRRLRVNKGRPKEGGRAVKCVQKNKEGSSTHIPLKA